MLWEASVLDPNEVSVPQLQRFFARGDSRSGHSFSWSQYSRLSKATALGSRWKGNDRRKHALAPTYWASADGNPDSDALPGACKAGRFTTSC
jgi:hypothetical protein